MTDTSGATSLPEPNRALRGRAAHRGTLRPVNIVLIGMRGVGKTNIARRLTFLTKRAVMSTDVPDVRLAANVVMTRGTTAHISPYSAPFQPR